MTKKIKPYFFLLIFFLAILILFRYSSHFIDTGDSVYNQYVSYHITENRLTIETSLGYLAIRFPADDIAEVEFFESNPADTSHAVIIKPDHYPVNFSDGDKSLYFTRDHFAVHIQKQPMMLTFLKGADTLLHESFGYFRNDSLQGFRFGLKENEKIYGAGFRTTPTNRRGQRFELYNQAHYGYSLDAPNLNFSVPFVLSSAHYGLLFDNAQKGFLDIDSTQKNMMEFSSIGGRMAYYVITGDHYDSIMNNYHRLTGYQPMPPRWALGNIQSKFGYRTQQEAEHIVDTMLSAGYPLDALVIDLFWFGEGTHDSFYMGDLEWYKKNWPAPEEMISRFAGKGVKTLLITEPYVLKESIYFDTLSQAGMLGKNHEGDTYILQKFWFGKGGLFDIFQPRMREWFWEKYDDQIKKGVDGWWGDLGEPETHPPEMFHVNGKAEEVHNIYAHTWHKMLYDRYAENYPGVRLFNLNRSGFAGSQRFSIYPWSGDVSRSWQGLQAQTTAVLGMTLSGFPYMHSDLGGFAQGTKDEELYVRWMQYGVFNPVFRPHGDSNAPVEPVFYSAKAQQILKHFIELRYELLPYNYTLAWMNSTKGIPMTRPLFFEEPDNDEIASVDNTYLWGPNLLVAPVLEQGRKKRKLYLPEGIWYDFFTDEKFMGGKWIEKDLTFDEIPVFARGDSFIPMIEPIKNTGEYSSKKLSVHYYVDENKAQADFTMYEDDGKTRNATEKGLYELLRFKAGSFDDFLIFTFGREHRKQYSGKPKIRNITLLVHGLNQKPDAVLINDEKRPVFQSDSSNRTDAGFIYYNAEKQQLTVNFNWATDKTRTQIIK